jgi:hypothetical protein
MLASDIDHLVTLKRQRSIDCDRIFNESKMNDVAAVGTRSFYLGCAKR